MKRMAAFSAMLLAISAVHPVSAQETVGKAPPEALVLRMGQRHEFLDGFAATVFSVDLPVEGQLSLLGGESETHVVAVVEIEICGGGDQGFFAMMPGGPFGLWNEVNGEIRYGWSGANVLWNGEPTVAPPDPMDPFLRGGECLRGSFPIGLGAGGSYGSVVLDKSIMFPGQTPEPPVLVAWLIEDAPR